MSCPLPVTKKINIAIYARISSTNQRDGLSLEAQVEKCTNAIVAAGAQVYAIIYETASGYTLNKGTSNPQASKMTQLCRMDKQKLFLNLLRTCPRGSMIMVSSADRLCRSIWKYNMYMEEAQKRGVTIICLGGTENEPTAMMSSLKEDEAEIRKGVENAVDESQKISARIRSSRTAMISALRKIRKDARPYFGGQVPYGKMIDTIDINGRVNRLKILVNHPEEMVVVKHVLNDTGRLTTTEIAHSLNINGYNYKGRVFTTRIVNDIIRSNRDAFEQDLNKLTAGIAKFNPLGSKLANANAPTKKIYRRK